MGTFAMPSFFAAMTRPCPATISVPFGPSQTATGSLKPNSPMLSHIWSICSLVWIFALRAYGMSDSVGTSSTVNSGCRFMAAPFLRFT